MKIIFMASDHAGFTLKEFLAEQLGPTYQIKNLGPINEDRVDYPDFAAAVAKAVTANSDSRGILVCGSGIGMSMAANKVHGIRAALCETVNSAQLSRQHNDANVLCLGQRIIEKDLALKIVQAWLSTEFEGGRHSGRVEKIMKIEREPK